jgi:hypothetical protein
MDATVFVLWLYLSHPWRLGPITVQAGWFGAAVFQDQETCLEGARNGTSPMICVAAGEAPDPALRPVPLQASGATAVNDQAEVSPGGSGLSLASGSR